MLMESEKLSEKSNNKTLPHIYEANHTATDQVRFSFLNRERLCSCVGAKGEEHLPLTGIEADMFTANVPIVLRSVGPEIKKPGEKDKHEQLELHFKVQVFALSKPLPPDSKHYKKFHDIDKIVLEAGQNKLLRYVTGSFNEYEQAAALKKKLIKRGIEGAFVAAYLNGHRLEIPAEKAVRIYAEKE